jgi:hypothetical protein
MSRVVMSTVLPAGSEVTMVTLSAGQVLPLAGARTAGAITHAAAVFPKRARRLSKLPSPWTRHFHCESCRVSLRRACGAAWPG